MKSLRMQKTQLALWKSRKNARWLLAAAVSLAGMTGCARHSGPPPSYVFADPEIRFPISVVHERQMMDVDFGTGKDGISESTRVELESFLSDFQRYGKGLLIVSAPAVRHRSAAGSFALAELREILEYEGINPTKIRMRTSSGSRYGRAGVTLTFYREVAQTPPCGSWPKNLADDRKNVPYENFGCAHRNNLAAMVARPGDLVRPRRTDDRHAGRREAIFEDYKKGELTSSKDGKKAGKKKK